MNIEKDLVAALATPLVLAILEEQGSYGYAILKRVRELSAGDLDWTDGMLYPLLHRLERFGYISSEWGASPEGRHRKNYEITDAGKVQLRSQRLQWETATRALSSVWGSGAMKLAGG